MYVDDDTDYIQNPETHFIGYVCPHGQCELILESHDSCLALLKRLEYAGGNKVPMDENDFAYMIGFNWTQWLIKTHNKILDRAL